MYYWLLTIVHPIHFSYFYCSYTNNIMKYLGMSRTGPQNVLVLTILEHLQKCPESICPMSFFYFSNLSHVLAQTCQKMCPWPDMSWTRPRRVPDVYSKFPCPDHFGTYPNRTSATKKIWVPRLHLSRYLLLYSNIRPNWYLEIFADPVNSIGHPVLELKKRKKVGLWPLALMIK